mmetsp:Transcript_11882/g.21602  ORF Transcript_11882/g.21602 Transcript_11882/m.21602 type:complete len:83 (-) Transcript_11882:710-958(-)
MSRLLLNTNGKAIGRLSCPKQQTSWDGSILERRDGDERGYEVYYKKKQKRRQCRHLSRVVDHHSSLQFWNTSRKIGISRDLV